MYSLGIAHNSADQFDETCGNAKKNASQIKPRSMQPAVKSRADEPSYDEGSRKYEGQLTITSGLHPKIFFPGGVTTLRIWFGGGHWGIMPTKRILR